MKGKKKILIVDDEVQIVNVITRLLSEAGYEVRKASGGKEAIEKIAEEQPDLVLLDINMPDMDGFEICRKLRSDPANDSLPIIMLTGKEEPSNIVRALEAGADDYVFKPSGKEELFKKIKSSLSQAEKEELPSQHYFKKKKTIG